MSTLYPLLRRYFAITRPSPPLFPGPHKIKIFLLNSFRQGIIFFSIFKEADLPAFSIKSENLMPLLTHNLSNS